MADLLPVTRCQTSSAAKARIARRPRRPGFKQAHILPCKPWGDACNARCQQLAYLLCCCARAVEELQVRRSSSVDAAPHVVGWLPAMHPEGLHLQAACPLSAGLSWITGQSLGLQTCRAPAKLLGPSPVPADNGAGSKCHAKTCIWSAWQLIDMYAGCCSRQHH